MNHRRVRPFIAALLVFSLAALATSSGSAARHQDQSSAGSVSDSRAVPASRYGPTAASPSGGETARLKPGAGRWRYRGVLGKLGPRERVVAPVADAPNKRRKIAPLTGERGRKLDRPAVVVKIDNVAPARPQSGIRQADVVYEELVEGGQTRFAAVFHSEAVAVVGPVRSARSSDIGLASSYNRPIFAYSGANRIFDALIDRARLINRGALRHNLYWRQSGRPAPHNLYTSTAALRESVAKAKAPNPQFTYRRKGEGPHEGAITASTIRLKFSARGGQPISYAWNAGSGGWDRRQGSTRHLDAAGVQVSPENVIVQIVRYVDSGLTDKFGEVLWEAVTVGTGTALVFTDGHVVQATWTKPSLAAPTTFTDRAGRHVRLTPGKTWVAVVPPRGVTFDSVKCMGRVATIVGTAGPDRIRGTAGRDVIAGLGGDDVVHAGAGIDLVCGGGGDDRVFGGAGADRLVGESGRDDLRGGPDNDILLGGPGADRLAGSAGADRLDGGAGRDRISGDPDVDEIILDPRDRSPG